LTNKVKSSFLTHNRGRRAHVLEARGRFAAIKQHPVINLGNEVVAAPGAAEVAVSDVTGIS
jgi:hypothetical protein